VPIKSLLSETHFDVTRAEMICQAFDDAWALLRGDGAADADPAKSSIIRTTLAKRIIEMAHREGMSAHKLRDDAVAHVKNNPLFF
jgi:hypothetical protein